jgi:hypothetical protein
MSEQDEIEIEIVEEQSSQNDRAKLEKSIRKDIFLAAKMAHHIMKNVELWIWRHKLNLTFPIKEKLRL